MGLTYRKLGFREVAHERNIRLDQEIYIAHEQFSDFIIGFKEVKPLAAYLKDIRNGVNYKADLYSQTANTGVLYLSVNQIASGLGRYLDLRDAKYLKIDLEDLELVLEPGDIVITRSGTPGIAWSADPDVLEKWDAVVPSGYTQRLQIETEHLIPEFLVAYLNSPPVRMLTKAAACGKDQPNLSQDYVTSIPIPTLTKDKQLATVKAVQRYQQSAKRFVELASRLRSYSEWEVVAALKGEHLPAIDIPELSETTTEVDFGSSFGYEVRLPARRQSDIQNVVSVPAAD